jgi:hypothetical protein
LVSDQFFEALVFVLKMLEALCLVGLHAAKLIAPFSDAPKPLWRRSAMKGLLRDLKMLADLGNRCAV